MNPFKLLSPHSGNVKMSQTTGFTNMNHKNKMNVRMFPN